MAYQFYIDEVAETVFIEHSDRIGTEETFEAFQDILGDPAYRSGMNFLRDTRFAELPHTRSYTHYSTVRAPKFQDVSAQMGTCKLAWVAGQGRNYRVANQAAMTNRLELTGKVERQPFVSLEEALVWLGLSPDHDIRHEEEMIRSYA